MVAGRQADMTLEQLLRASILRHNHDAKSGTGHGLGFETFLKPAPSDTSPLALLHSLILPKQLHQLVTKDSKIRVYWRGVILIQTTTPVKTQPP